MEIVKDEIWALIPARGGSKSIPLKNLARLGGRPLIDYVIAAARSSRSITRTVCSTDHQSVAKACSDRMVEIHWRPSELSGDNVPVLDVLVHLLRDIGTREGKVPDIVCLLQPTSPFVLPDVLDDAVEKLKQSAFADSAQTVTRFPHNFHAYNQRVVEDGCVSFRFPVERKIHYNKQTKPIYYIFGNLIVSRSRTLLEKGDIFGEHSLPIVIPLYYAADIDTAEDLDWAEWLLASRKVVLPYVDFAGA
jgi:CMP-N-acetylneuraminic acid synthetase